MMSGIYAATSGLDAHQSMLDVASDNLANVDTVGYKRERAQFSDALARHGRRRHDGERLQRR